MTTTPRAIRPFEMFLRALCSPNNSCDCHDDAVIAETTFRAEGSTFAARLTVKNLRDLVATAPASADVAATDVHDVLQGLAGLCVVHPHHTDLRNAMDLIAKLQTALTAALAEGERLNKWADGFDAAAMKERQLADVRIKELNARVVTLETALKPFSNAWKKGWRLNGLQSVQQYVGEDDYRGAFDAIEQR